MIISWLDREIVWIKIKGELLADELIPEVNGWLDNHKNEYVGYMIDIREMTRRTSLEQQKVEEAYKKNKSGKVRALLGKDETFRIAVNIYMRFTNAESIRYFTNEQEAREWIMSFKKKQS